MMRFELGLEQPDPKRAVRSAATIGASYIGGGLIPLAPYFFPSDLRAALAASVAVTLSALFVFGCCQGSFYRHFRVARRISNHFHRRPGGCGSVRYRRVFFGNSIYPGLRAFASIGRLKPDSGGIIFNQLIIFYLEAA